MHDLANEERRHDVSDQQNITRLLESAAGGSQSAEAELFRSVYSELHKIARSHRRRWRGNETLSTTVLVNEAYLKLAGDSVADYRDRSHFYATASKAMRQVLMNYAEKHAAKKRGGEWLRVTLADNTPATEDVADWLLSMNSLLEELEDSNPRHCRIVECRLFGGMSVDETAAALDVSARTVKRDWALVSAWLYREMGVAS